MLSCHHVTIQQETGGSLIRMISKKKKVARSFKSCRNAPNICFVKAFYIIDYQLWDRDTTLLQRTTDYGYHSAWNWEELAIKSVWYCTALDMGEATPQQAIETVCIIQHALHPNHRQPRLFPISYTHNVARPVATHHFAIESPGHAHTRTVHKKGFI